MLSQRGKGVNARDDQDHRRVKHDRREQREQHACASGSR